VLQLVYLCSKKGEEFDFSESHWKRELVKESHSKELVKESYSIRGLERVSHSKRDLLKESHSIRVLLE
jgi:hypothetical protein